MIVKKIPNTLSLPSILYGFLNLKRKNSHNMTSLLLVYFEYKFILQHIVNRVHVWFQSWMGEITSNDNLKFTVLNLNQKLRPGPPVLSRIMVKFNQSTGSPKLRFIRLNGRKICPEDSSESPSPRSVTKFFPRTYRALHFQVIRPSTRNRLDPYRNLRAQEGRIPSSRKVTEKTWTNSRRTVTRTATAIDQTRR